MLSIVCASIVEVRQAHREGLLMLLWQEIHPIIGVRTQFASEDRGTVSLRQRWESRQHSFAP